MDLKKLTLEEYQNKKTKTYLEECLENGMAEYYIVNYNGKEYQFLFYKNNDTAEICVKEKSPNSLFDYGDAMNEIFSFLKERGYKKVTITLEANKFIERQELAIRYGFNEIRKFEHANVSFIEYYKNL